MLFAMGMHSLRSSRCTDSGDLCRLGDHIYAEVTADHVHQGSFLLCSILVLQPWKDASDVCFIPRPLRAYTQPACDPIQHHRQADSHAKPAEAGQNACQPCKYWVNSGACPKGDSCKYDHPQGGDLVVARQQWVSGRCASILRFCSTPRLNPCTIEETL